MDSDLQNDPTLKKIVSKLKGHFKPEKIFLFGSKANGASSADSDYDILLVVKESEKTKFQRMDEANFVLWGRTHPVDVFVYTEKEFENEKNQFQSIPQIVFSEGKELDFEW